MDTRVVNSTVGSNFHSGDLIKFLGPTIIYIILVKKDIDETVEEIVIKGAKKTKENELAIFVGFDCQTCFYKIMSNNIIYYVNNSHFDMIEKI